MRLKGTIRENGAEAYATHPSRDEVALSSDSQAIADLRTQLTNGFLWSATIILVVTGLLKLMSAAGDARALSTPDPLFEFLSLRQLLLGAAFFEIVLAVALRLTKNQVRSLLLVAWIGTIFLVYRVGLWSIGYHGPCSCLGNVFGSLGITPEIADLGAKVVLGYLLSGSAMLLAWHFRDQPANLGRLNRNEPDVGRRMA